MALDSEEIITIYNETVLGKPLSIDTDEARAFREKILPEINEARREGKTLDIPFELHGVESETSETPIDGP